MLLLLPIPILYTILPKLPTINVLNIKLKISELLLLMPSIMMELPIMSINNILIPEFGEVKEVKPNPKLTLETTTCYRPLVLNT